MDTVFNTMMRPVFSRPPEEVKRRLKYGYPDDWSAVCIGETQEIVSITEYLYKEKFTEVRNTLKEIVGKEGLPMYKRSPERFEQYLDRIARRLIERILEK